LQQSDDPYSGDQIAKLKDISRKMTTPSALIALIQQPPLNRRIIPLVDLA